MDKMYYYNYLRDYILEVGDRIIGLDKTLLEDAWIGSEFQCHRKARHRMRFVRKNATWRQKIQFYLL